MTSWLPLVFVIANGPATVSMQIQKQYDRWSTAYMAHDLDTMLDILSPAYELITFDKTVIDYPEYAASLRLKKNAKTGWAKYFTRVRSVHLHGAVADVIAVETMDTNFVMDGKPFVCHHRHEYLDTWVEPGGEWKLKRSETRKETTEVAARSIAGS